MALRPAELQTDQFVTASAYLNQIVVELFAHAKANPDNRSKRLGKLFIVDRPELANQIFDQPDVFQKNFGLVAAVGGSRFNLNGGDWLALRAKTQPHYAKAGRPGMAGNISAFYREEIFSAAPLSVKSLQTALARAALRVFFSAFDLAPDVNPFLDHFSRLRAMATVLQYRTWTSEGQDRADRDALLAAAAELAVDFWRTCERAPSVARTIANLASSGNPIDEGTMASDFMTNMFAGIETTTASIAWMIDCLGRNVQVQDRLYQEAITQAETTPYLDCFRDETMRLFPAIPFVIRQISKDFVMGDTRLTAGENVLISIIGIHRDREIWSEADIFLSARPEFLGRQARALAGFRPFLSGPRVCGGRRIAEMEIAAALRLLVKNFEFHNPQQNTAFQYNLALRPLLSNDIVIRPRQENLRRIRQ